ncbi:hypothetical protein BSKO_06086 [Bryopsis sp. KO-2023]|nr:hypothetical protein BSKO_06086 [Bryopsis sp. KO-2023]
MEQEKLPVLSSVTVYEKIARVGEGTYGVVYKARHRTTGQLVALKRVRMDREMDGLPVTFLRELRLLQTMRHSNIVKLLDVATGSKKDSLFLVFEFCSHDLANLDNHLREPFSVSEIKCLLKQILSGLAYLHNRKIIHRDVKLSNLLYTDDGVVKLCDFGLARFLPSKAAPLTPQVFTLWYRGPELLLGCCEYGTALDMWAVGCIFAELLRGKPLFPGKTEFECLRMMCQRLGTPTPDIWKDIVDLPNYQKIVLPAYDSRTLKNDVPKASECAIDLLRGFLAYDPKQRLTAEEALQHPYFEEHPLPKPLGKMPRFPSLHDRSGKLRGVQRVERDREADSSFGDLFGDRHQKKARR